MALLELFVNLCLQFAANPGMSVLLKWGKRDARDPRVFGLNVLQLPLRVFQVFLQRLHFLIQLHAATIPPSALCRAC